MSPVTFMVPLVMEMVPADTTSPITLSVLPPFTVMAVPPAPPHPAWSSAAMAGVYARLLTEPPDVAARLGLVPLVRMAPNCSTSDLVAVMVNWLPCGPNADTDCRSDVPSLYVHVRV